jgi:hypothetical protein
MVLPKRQESQHESVTWSLVGADNGVAGVVLTGQLGSATADGTANSSLLPIFAGGLAGQPIGPAAAGGSTVLRSPWPAAVRKSKSLNLSERTLHDSHPPHDPVPPRASGWPA